MFERHLRGVFSLSEVSYAPPQDAVPINGKRRWAEGKTKDVVAAYFGTYEITLAAPSEVPPLGRVTLIHDGEFVLTGLLDQGTLDRVGRAIIENQRQPERAT